MTVFMLQATTLSPTVKSVKVSSHRPSPSRQRNKRYVDGQNGYAIHSERHSFRQKDQSCRPSTLR